VTKLRITLVEGRVLEFRKVASGPCDNPCDSKSGNSKKPSRLATLKAQNRVPRAGLEPN
jgi:hypothetical protein